MRMKRIFIWTLAILCLLLSVSASAGNTLNLSAETFDSVDTIEERIRQAEGVSYVNLTDVTLSTDERLKLMEDFPDVFFLWTIDLFGKSCSSAQTTLDMSWKKPTDYQEFIKLLKCLPNLERVDLFKLYVSRDDMALLTKTFPNIRFGFTFKMGGYTIRTDVTSFSTLKDGTPPYLSSNQVKVFKYCKDMLALDLGHNALTDLDFLYDMPQLKVLILACNRIEDITPIASLKNLEYLEIFKNPITDLSPLAGLDKLIDLNVANLQITDVSALNGLTQLERLWLPLNKKVPAEQLEALKAALPNTQIMIEGSGSTEGGWRSHSRYKIIYRMFHYGSYLPWDAPPLGE